MHADRLRTAVIIPVYRADYLEECLASVFAQTHPPDEVIVVDDGSPDSATIEAVVAHYHSRVRVRCEMRLLRQDHRGAEAARKLGILSTDADLIAFLDADDVWAPTLLEKHVGRVRDTTDLDLDANGLVIGQGPLANSLLISRRHSPPRLATAPATVGAGSRNHRPVGLRE